MDKEATWSTADVTAYEAEEKTTVTFFSHEELIRWIAEELVKSPLSTDATHRRAIAGLLLNNNGQGTHLAEKWSGVALACGSSDERPLLTYDLDDAEAPRASDVIVSAASSFPSVAVAASC
jgi:hypothetical protein